MSPLISHLLSLLDWVLVSSTHSTTVTRPLLSEAGYGPDSVHSLRKKCQNLHSLAVLNNRQHAIECRENKEKAMHFNPPYYRTFGKLKEAALLLEMDTE